MSTRTAADIDLLNLDNFVPSVPHHMFDWLREYAPVYFHPEPGGPGFWCLTKWADVDHASREWKTYSSAKGTNIEDAEGGYELAMVNQDPPYHTKLRNLVRKGFTPRIVDAMEPHIREMCTKILDKVAPLGECDFVTDVAAELPLQVIAELLGVPLEERHLILDWSNRMMGAGPGIDPEYGTSREDATLAATKMWAYAGELAELRKKEPKEDLVSILTHAEVDGEQLTDFEFQIFFLLLAVAGNETTRNLVAGGMHALMENPDQRERLMKDRSLLPTAIEEMLRWVTPVMYFRRTATEDTEIRGTKIRAGDKVLMWYIAANRDEEKFPNPHQFDVGREPNEHLTFGAGGPHFCLGFNVARLEIQIMFDELLDRFPDMEMTGPLSRLRGNFVNGHKHLPVRFTPDKS
jgi:cholest-4-en-3-one 26-monooxygenase